MNQNDKYLKESVDFLSREFGQPLHNLNDVMKKHQENKVSETSVNESPKDVQILKRNLQALIRTEERFRRQMYDIEQRFQADGLNHKLMTPLKKSYRKNVTTFMREVIAIVKKAK